MDAVYKAVRKSCPVPLSPEWSDWLYRRMKKEQSNEKLYGTGRVLMLTVDEEKLDAMISEGMRNGEIDF